MARHLQSFGPDPPYAFCVPRSLGPTQFLKAGADAQPLRACIKAWLPIGNPSIAVVPMPPIRPPPRASIVAQGIDDLTFLLPASPLAVTPQLDLILPPARADADMTLEQSREEVAGRETQSVGCIGDGQSALQKLHTILHQFVFLIFYRRSVLAQDFGNGVVSVKPF